ncbi:MAG: FHA domain-containing protein [Armatimonadota bacterium]|nr:FHA domain-containing protein [bacterium]
MKKVLICVVILAIAASAACAATKINVEKKGSYVYWLTCKNALGEVVTTLPEAFKGKGTEIDTKTLPVKFTGGKLFVMNKKTGNMAIIDYAAPKDEKSAKPIELTNDDFQYVRNVRLKVVSEDGAPVERVIVRITDGMGTEMNTVVTPADGGIASFNDVATGEITVKVDAEGLRKTVDSDITLPEKRKAPGFEREIEVSGDVDTLPVEASAKTNHTAAKPESKPGVGAYILPSIVGIMFLAIIIGIFYAIFKSRGITAGGALKKIGVDLPSDQPVAQPAAETQPAADPNVCQFCGQHKDANGNCACTIAPGASPFSTSSQSAGPRLIGTQGVYAGQILDIPQGTAIIGREATNHVALTNDSTTSRRHAVITSAGGEFMIRDEGSSNGTFVNGARITEQKLTSGDEIQIGGSKFRIEF